MTNQRLAEATDALWRAVDERRDELIGTVAELVRRPSLLGDEAPVQISVAEHLRGSGLPVEAWDLDEAIKALPNAGDSGVPFAGRPNVTAKRAGRGGGRSLILNGHVDVVSPEPAAAWSHDPWGAEIVGERMYGRGAYDMKSGVALNLFLPRLLHDLGIGLGGDLFVHSVIEEECTGNGALAASLRDRADAAVVTEPEHDSFTHAHLGVIWFRVRISGRSAHAAVAWQGVNAIVKAVPIIEALRALDARLNEEVHPLWRDVIQPINLNIGVIQGGDWPSTVAGACELHCRVSFNPGVGVPAMRAIVEETIRQAAGGDDWLRANPPVVRYDGFQTDGAIVALDEPFLALLKQSHRRVTGRELEARVATGVNDMRYYLFQGIPATCYGAAGGNAHAADEWLDLTSLAPTAKALGAFVLEWCGVA